ncbi:hypothetical protein V7161_29250 [Neobacillus drentensis]
MLKVIVDFVTLLIGTEGARLLREDGAGETPQALQRREGSPDRPRKAKHLERKSTAKFNTANLKIDLGLKTYENDGKSGRESNTNCKGIRQSFN